MSKPGGGGQPFWKAKTFGEMRAAEWETLCDGCGRCCVHRAGISVSGRSCRGESVGPESHQEHVVHWIR